LSLQRENFQENQMPNFSSPFYRFAILMISIQ